MSFKKTPPALGMLAKTGYMSEDGWIDCPPKTPEERLAHILWRNAKQLVSLLEKVYGFGQEKPTRQPFVGATARDAADSLKSGMKVRPVGKEWPLYHIGSTICDQLVVFIETMPGHIPGLTDVEHIQDRIADGELEIVELD